MILSAYRAKQMALAVLSILLGFWRIECYRVVRVVDNSSTNSSDSLVGKVFFIHNDVASVIHHRETWMELGFTDDSRCERLRGAELYSWRDPKRPSQAVARFACIEKASPLDVSKYKRGPPLPSLERKETTLDASMMMEMTKVDIVQGQMVFDKMFIQLGINPSVLEWREQMLMATSLGWPIEEAQDHLVSGRRPSECVEFNWINKSSLNSAPLIHKGKLTRNLPKNQRVVYPFEGVFMGLSGATQRLDRMVGGQDPRLIVLDENHVGMVVTELFSGRRLRVGFVVIGANMTRTERSAWCANSDIDVLRASPAYLRNDKERESYEDFYGRIDNHLPYGNISSPGDNVVVTHSFSDLETGDRQHDEKNWSPFLFDVEGKNKTRNLLFVRSINPLVVMRASWSKVSSGGVVPVQTVSSAKALELSFWSYGSLRGGTNPLLIEGGWGKVGQDPFYLAIFHSVSTIPGDGVFKSYTMGAYTFTAQVPFRLTAVSALPFMDKDLYQGQYAENFRRMNDYVVFPMTLTRDTKRTLLLSFGWQDRYAMLGRLDLQAVIDTLVPV
jgi:hypothetical protein